MINQLTNKIKRIDGKIDYLFKQDHKSATSNQPEKRQVESKPLSSPEVVKKPIMAPAPAPPRTKIPPPMAAHSMPAARPIIAKPSKPSQPAAAAKPSFIQRNPDLEKFIGENLLSKIGIVIFVIGMGFLVKLGIDNGVITEIMRVAIGILIGGGMIGLAHYLRNSFANFSSVLIGGALAVLYFTIALAYHEYTLIPQAAAFIIMVIITAFAVLLSIAYDRKTLAVLAIIGGFGTPFFVSMSSANFGVLLTYILILDIGMLALVYFKKWNIINYLAYGFTYLLFLRVYTEEFIGHEDDTRLPLFLFLTAFYLIFFLMNIIYNVRNVIKFEFPEIGMLLSNSAIYFGLGLTIVNGYQVGDYSGLFTALIAIFNFVFAFMLYKRKDIDKNLIYLLIGLGLTFVSLIGPIQLEGNYITMFWAIETVLLVWLSQKSGINIMKVAAIIVTALMLFSLFLDWQQNYYPISGYVVLEVFLNKAFITSFVAMASVSGIILLLKQDERIDVLGSQFVLKRVYAKVILAVVFYLGFLLELNYQFIRLEYENTLRLILLGIYNYAFIIALLALKHVKPTALLKKVSFILSGMAIISYITVYLQQVTLARSYNIINEDVVSGYYWHYLLFALFIVILVDLYIDIYRENNFKSKEGKGALWALAFIAIFVSTTEINHISMVYQFGSGISQSEAYDVVVKSVFPVVWALVALVLMILGMKFKLKTIRIASLALFAGTIIKLFFYDLAGNTTGKIVSFILLGIILLVISFLYQKLKFIVQDDENKY